MKSSNWQKNINIHKQNLSKTNPNTHKHLNWLFTKWQNMQKIILQKQYMQVLFVLNIEFILLSHLFNQKVLSIEAFLLIALYLFVRYTLVRLSISYKSYRSIFLPILAKETIYFKASFIVLQPYIYTTNDPLMTSNLDL